MGNNLRYNLRFTMHSNSRREGELGVGAEVGSLWGSKEKERGKNVPQGGRKRYKCILLLF